MQRSKVAKGLLRSRVHPQNLKYSITKFRKDYAENPAILLRQSKLPEHMCSGNLLCLMGLVSSPYGLCVPPPEFCPLLRWKPPLSLECCPPSLELGLVVCCLPLLLLLLLVLLPNRPVGSLQPAKAGSRVQRSSKASPKCKSLFPTCGREPGSRRRRLPAAVRETCAECLLPYEDMLP